MLHTYIQLIDSCKAIRWVDQLRLAHDNDHVPEEGRRCSNDDVADVAVVVVVAAAVALSILPGQIMLRRQNKTPTGLDYSPVLG